MKSWSEWVKNSDKRLDHEEIDEFLHHLNKSINRRIKELEAEFDLLSKQSEDTTNNGYLEHLEDLLASVNATKSLGDELSIIALYKKVESHSIRLVKKKGQSFDAKKLSHFNCFCQALPFKIEDVDGYLGFNELRLLNNAIKHNEGKVSTELAKNFPQWNGKEGQELSDELGTTFQRLLPEVKRYVSDLAERLYAVAP